MNRPAESPSQRRPDGESVDDCGLVEERVGSDAGERRESPTQRGEAETATGLEVGGSPLELGDRTPPPQSEIVGGAAHPKRIGDYEILSTIAHGGMGVVYRARQISLNRIVALKMVLSSAYANPAALQRSHREAESAARLQHPHIVSVHEVGEYAGQPYYSMDYVEGKSLAVLTREHPLTATRSATT